MRRPGTAVPVWLFLGAVLMQAAWILALPPFRGVDEFDHAYRATAVARGQWLPDQGAADHGRGDLVIVPNSLVDAARPECSVLPYTGHDNCNPVENVGDGLVTVASAAARYNPAFYFVIGSASRPFEGTNALYAMRITAAILCALFIALAGWAVGLWARTRWPLVSLLVALTPVAIYSTAVAAPNGIEMCAAAALWATLLGFSRRDLAPATERALLWASLPSSVTLATVRSLGPVWLFLVVISALAVIGLKPACRVVMRHPRTCAAIGAVSAAATVASVWWVLISGANQAEEHGNLSHPVQNSISRIPLWFLQSIAAFPTRSERAPTVVYAASGLTLVALVCTGFMLGRARLRLALFGVLATAGGVALAVSIKFYSDDGAIWQGRYGLPYAFGVVLLAGLALEAKNFRHRLVGPGLLAGWGALVCAHTVGVTGVVIRERLHSPQAGTDAWMTPPPSLVAVLIILGWVGWAMAVHRRGRRAGTSGSMAECLPEDSTREQPQLESASRANAELQPATLRETT